MRNTIQTEQDKKESCQRLAKWLIDESICPVYYTDKYVSVFDKDQYGIWFIPDGEWGWEIKDNAKELQDFEEVLAFIKKEFNLV